MNSFPLYLILSLISLCHCVDIMYFHINQENNLYFIFTTFRHGARKELFGKDLFGNINYFVEALTKYWVIQLLEIGRNYRKRISYDKNELYIPSSDIERTIVFIQKNWKGFLINL